MFQLRLFIPWEIDVPRIREVANLPGSDASRSLALAFLAMVLLAVTQNAPSEIPERLRDISMISALAVGFLVMIGCTLGQRILDESVESVRSARALYVPKLLVDSAMIIFIVVVASWNVLLGGILVSPFGSLMVAAPVVYAVILTDRRAEEAFRKYRDAGVPQCGRLGALSTALDWIPAVIMACAITLGEYVVYRSWRGSLMMSDEVFAELLLREWWRWVAYGVFYVGACAAVVSVIPRDIKASIERGLGIGVLDGTEGGNRSK